MQKINTGVAPDKPFFYLKNKPALRSRKYERSEYLFSIDSGKISAFFSWAQSPQTPLIKFQQKIYNSVTKAPKLFKTLWALRLQFFIFFITKIRRLQNICNLGDDLFMVTNSILTGYNFLSNFFFITT